MGLDSFAAFFGACAGVSGALIGLLFVSVSLAPDRIVRSAAPAQTQESAAGALVILSDTLFVSLAALIPGFPVGLMVIVCGVGALVGTTVYAVGSYLQRKEQPLEMRWWWRRAITVAILGAQLVVGLRLLTHPDGPEYLREVAVLMLFLYAVGLKRAWELLGGRGYGLLDAAALWRRHPESDAGG